MDAREVFEQLMQNEENIALATSVNNVPSVRIVSFLWDNNKIYFTSFKGKPKNDEIDANSKVAFTTVENKNMYCVRVNDAECKLADVKLEDLREKFVAKMPGFKMAFDMAIDQMELYQIEFKKAKVTLEYRKIEEIEL